jgi:hypothetical protein
MTIRTRTRKSKTLPLTAKRKSELKLEDIFKAFYKSELYIHVKYIGARLFYLLQTLVIGWFIQFFWNLAMVQWFNGEHQVNLFEAAILWICVY